MKSLFYFLALSFIAATAYGAKGSYDKQGGNFYVMTRDGKTHRQSVDANYQNALLSCQGKLCALYDGDDLHIFNEETSIFIREGVDDAYANARLKVTNAFVALYDGDDLYIYSAEKKTVLRQGVDDNYLDIALAVSNQFVALYDGDDLYVYTNQAGINRTGVDDNYTNWALAITRAGVLFYDGDDLYSYCNNSFNRDGSVQDLAENSLIYDSHDRVEGIAIGAKNYYLLSNCTIKDLPAGFQ